ncbi:MAG: cold shock domain-containing protein [Burkholderiales bacterium]|nr:cold shock domain-containing protein [Burkholderiales bacterium]
MSENRCTIAVVVNGGRWVQEAAALLAQNAIPRAMTLGGLHDYVRIAFGGKLGYTMEQTSVVMAQWCRARPTDSDGEAVAAGFAVVTAPHVTDEDMGAGLALEAVEVAVKSGAKVIVMVGAQMAWTPLRQKVEAANGRLFELLLLPTGKVQVSTESVTDLRDLARNRHATTPVSALFKPLPVAPGSGQAAAVATAEPDDSFAANAIVGVVKSLAKGYGIVTRKDGRGDVQFLPGHVAPPGFEFIEVGDTLRFDVVRTPAGKWLAQRVVRA